MNILGFDTCLDKMYVTLGNSFEIIDSKVIETTKEHYHSAFLISTIKSVLKDNGLTPQDVDVVATNIGPGSFTGIRACTTVARVFSQGVDNVKTIGVSSLEILSRLSQTQSVMLSETKHLEGTDEILRLMPQNDKVLVALDARKEMAYVAVYENKKEIFAPKAVLISELTEMLNKENYFVVTDDKLKNIIVGISYMESDRDLGAFLVQIAAEKITLGCETDWKKLHPLYIQPPPITVKKTQ